MGIGYINSKRTDGKLILREISISRNISVHETVKEKIICSKPKINTATKTIASHAGILRGARIRAPLKTPAWEATKTMKLKKPFPASKKNFSR